MFANKECAKTNIAAVCYEIIFIFPFKRRSWTINLMRTFSIQHIGIISTSLALSKGVSMLMPWRLYSEGSVITLFIKKKKKYLQQLCNNLWAASRKSNCLIWANSFERWIFFSFTFQKGKCEILSIFIHLQSKIFSV